MRRWHKLAFAVMAWTAAIGAAAAATAQTKPEGEMRFALYVTVPPSYRSNVAALPSAGETPCHDRGRQLSLGLGKFFLRGWRLTNQFLGLDCGEPQVGGV
jgi:hypothetical protein